MDVPDDELVKRCITELPYVTVAYEVLLRRYEPLVFRTCLRYLKNRQEAEEAGQDVFLRVYHALPKFEAKSTFRTWLFRIVNNVCATRYQKRKRQSEQREAYLDQLDLPDKPYETANPGEIGGPLSDALDRLSDEDRQILVLRHISDLSLEEIAASLDIGLSAAKMRLYRSQQRLREQYGASLEKTGKNSGEATPKKN